MRSTPTAAAETVALPGKRVRGIAVVPTAVARVSRGTPDSFGGTPKDATATVALPKP